MDLECRHLVSMQDKNDVVGTDEQLNGGSHEVDGNILESRAQGGLDLPWAGGFSWACSSLRISGGRRRHGAIFLWLRREIEGSNYV